MTENPGIFIKHEMPQQKFPESELLVFVEKIYAKVPTVKGLPDLKGKYVKAIAN